MVVGSSGCTKAGATARSQSLASVAVSTIVGHTCTLLTACFSLRAQSKNQDSQEEHVRFDSQTSQISW